MKKITLKLYIVGLAAIANVLATPFTVLGSLTSSIAVAAPMTASTVTVCDTQSCMATETQPIKLAAATTETAATGSDTDTVAFAPNPIAEDEGATTGGPSDPGVPPKSGPNIAQISTSPIGGYVAMETNPPSLAIDGYDLNQIQAMNKAYNALVAAGPATLKQYQKDGPNGKLPADVLQKIGLGDQPNIDARSIKTLLYLTDPAPNGAGLDWLRVTSINRGYQTASNQFSKDQDPGAEPTVSPHHYGEGITVSEIGKMKGTKFTYEVDVPQDQANQQLDLSKIDYSQARIIDKQPVAETPIQVGWQNGGSASGNSPDFTGDSMASILTQIGSSKDAQVMKDNGAECVDAAGTLATNTIANRNSSLGLGCVRQATNPYISFGSDPLSNVSNSAKNLLAAVSGLSAAGFGPSNPQKGVTPQLVMGAANFAPLLGISPAFITDPSVLVTREKLLAGAAQSKITKMFDGYSERNEFAGIATGPDAFARAVGLSWMEDLAGRTLSVGDFQSIDKVTGKEPINHAFLFADDTDNNNYKINITVLRGLSDDAANKFAALKTGSGSAEDFFAAVGKAVITQKRVESPDAYYGLSLHPPTGSHELFDKLVNGDQSVLVPIGAAMVASRASTETSMQDAYYTALVTGTTPTDSTGLATVDYQSIDARLKLQPGDFKAIFLDGQGWGVLQRQGLIQYASLLNNQGQSLITQVGSLGNQSGALYTGSFITDQLNNLKNQGQSLVSSLQAQLRNAPNQALGSVVSGLNAQLNAINQGVFNDINARLAQESATNPADQLLRNMQGSLSYLAGSGLLSPSQLSQLYDMNNVASQSYAPGLNLTNFSQWTGGSFSGSAVVTPQQFAAALAAGQNGTVGTNTDSLNWIVFSLGLEQYYNTVLASTTQPLTNTLDSITNLITTARLAIQSAGYTLNSFDPRNISLTKTDIYNFVMQDLIAGTPAADWAQELNLAYRLIDDPNYQLTASDIRGLITGTSAKALAKLGAKQTDIAYGLSAITPFISVLTGEQSFQTAVANAATQTGLQYLYSFTGQMSKNPTVNAAVQIFSEEALGILHDSLTDSKTFFAKNSPATVLGALGLIPTEVTLLQSVDPVGYQQAITDIYGKLRADPGAFADQISASAAARGLPKNLADFVAGKTDGAGFANALAVEPGTGFITADHTAQARAMALELCGGNENSPDFQKTLALTTKMAENLSYKRDDKGNIQYQDNGIIPVVVDEAAGRDAATQAYLIGVSSRTGSVEDILDAHLGRMGARLADVGLTAVDDQIAGITGIPNVLRTFYRSKNPQDAAINLGWQALTQYVNFPAELTNTLGYFGGDPLSIAKTFTEGRAGAAFGTLAAGQLYNLTKDAGVSIAAGDFLAAQFGPNVDQMKQYNEQAVQQRRANEQKIESDELESEKQLGITLSSVNRAKAVSDMKNDLLLNPSVDELRTKKIEAVKQGASKSFQYAMMDYAATLSIRSASGNQLVSMSGFAKTMIEGKPQEQALFLINLLNGFTNNELSQYLGDAAAAQQIYQYLHDSAPIVVDGPPVINNITGEEVPGRPFTATPNDVKVPTAAFSYVDSRMSQLLGFQVPSGFTQGLTSFARTGSFEGHIGNLPSMKDILTSVTVQTYVGNWLDKQAGLPQGTSFTMYQLFQQYQETQKLLTQATQAAQAASNASLTAAIQANGALEAVQAGGTTGQAAAAAQQQAAQAATQAQTAKAALEAAKVKMASVISVAINFAVQLAFSKTFSQWDEDLGLPPGTISTLVGAAITLGVGLAVGADLLLLFGGPVGIALLVGGLLAGFIFNSGSNKSKTPVTRQFTRVFYSTTGVQPGLEGPAAPKLVDLPPKDITQSPAVSAYDKAPVPVANQPLTEPKTSIRFLVTDSKGKPLNGTVSVTNPKATPAKSDAAATAAGPKVYDVALGNDAGAGKLILKDLSNPGAAPIEIDTTLPPVVAATVQLDPSKEYVAQFKPNDVTKGSTNGRVKDGRFTATSDGVSVDVKPAAANQASVVPISGGTLILPAVAAETTLQLSFSLQGISPDPQGGYDGKRVELSQGADKILVTPAAGIVNSDGSISRMLSRNDLVLLGLSKDTALSADQSKTLADTKPVKLTPAQTDALGITVGDAPIVAASDPLSSLFGSSSSSKVVVSKAPTLPKPTEETVDSYDGGKVTLVGPALGAKATIKTYTAGTTPHTGDTIDLITPTDITKSTGGKILGPDDQLPDGFDAATVQTNELATQKFTNPMNPIGLPLNPATFEANTGEQFGAHVPNAAQYALSSFIGHLLYMPDRINNRSSENPSSDPQGWFIRPSQIKTYGTANRYLGKLTLPRYESQLDRLYGYESEDGFYENAAAANRLYGLGANDHWSQAIDVTW